MKIQVLKDGPVVDVVDNGFCPTGQGGGVDPTCGKGGGGKGVAKVKNPQYTKARKTALRAIKRGGTSADNHVEMDPQDLSERYGLDEADGHRLHKDIQTAIHKK